MISKRPLDRVVHGFAGAGPLLFFAIATIEGALRPDYDPIREPISALALGPRGWVQELNFALLTASFLAFAWVARTQLRRGVASVAAPAVFVVMTIGVALAGVFPMNAPGTTPTLDGRLHELAGFLVFPWIPVALLLLARRFRRDADWQPYFKYTLATGLFCLVTIVLFLIFVGPPSSPPLVASDFRGLVQRIMLIPFFSWMALIARRSFRRADHASVTLPLSDASRPVS
jgi:hypothetical membrane protein